jgi:dTDP-4-dehydrorhamnose 3,5-epimerase
MKFIETRLPGAFIIEFEPVPDNRGWFARSFCSDEFAEHGLHNNFVQCNISYNLRRGTLRGMHYQVAPHTEAKLIRCVTGSIYDVIIDLRPQSGTHLQWQAFEMDRHNNCMLYVPEGFAHGFQTQEDNTEVFYQMSSAYEPSAASGIRWNDPLFAIDWPIPELIISDKDAMYPDYQHA